MHPNKNLLIILIYLLITDHGICQARTASHFDPYNTYDSLSFDVYIGEVTGITKNKFNTLYITGPNGSQMSPITNSAHFIEIRLHESAPFPLGVFRCYQLIYDSSFQLRVFDGYKKIIEDTGEYRANADSLYDLLIENAVFSLPPYKKYFKKDRSAYVSKQTGIKKYKIEEINFSDGAWYTVEYKVGDKFNRVDMSFPYLQVEQFPDDQLFRRYEGIVRAFKKFYKGKY